MNKTKVTKDLENKTLIIERVFDAPVESVWSFYAIKEKFEAWWGPEGWETTTKAFDFSPGGKIHYGMTCVDENQTEWFGKQSWGLMEIDSIEENKNFVAHDFFCSPDGTIDQSMPAQKFVVEFHDENGRTRLVNRSILDSAEKIEMLVEMGMIEGFNSQMNKLEVLLQD